MYSSGMGGQHLKRRLMKDGLGPESVQRLARNLARGQADFDVQAFVQSATRELDKLELKARVAHVAAAMGEHLPSEFPKAIAGIRQAIASWERGPESDALRGFAVWPVFVYVEQQGRDDCALSLEALRELTHLFTAEFALRPFVQLYPKQTMAEVARWTAHSSDHVRRLASEGIRPRLPWASRLPAFQDDPTPVLHILDKLKDDESEYVRRSVANCLADIAVDHADLVIATCKQWRKGASQNRRWVIKRGTRNLIKSGHPGVWSLHGFTENPDLRVEGLRVVPRRVSLDQKFEIEFELRSEAKSEQRLVVDFVVHHVKASGKTAAKVFKLSEVRLPAGARMDFSKTHAFRNITTRSYYPGRHRIEIQVNGERYSETELELQI